ncbi:MAG: ligand-binding sensor domain-containing protein [Chitinophagaceae bacterium]
MRRFVSYIVSALLYINAQSQTTSIFKNITTANGLPSNYVFGTTEDEFGFLWVATDKGLCRFNGNTWEVFDTDNGLPGNYINAVLKDAKIGGLWLGISEKGLYHFNTTTYEIEKVNTKTNKVQITLNNQKRIWLHTIYGDYELNDKGMFETSYTRGYYEKNTFFNYNIEHKKLDTFIFNNTTQVQNKEHKYYFPKIQLGVELINFQIPKTLINNGWILKNHNSKIEILQYPFFKNKTASIHAIKTDSTLFIAQVSGGLYAITSNKTIRKFTTADGLTSDEINNIYNDVDGNLLVSTLGKGIFILPKKQQSIFSVNEDAITGLSQANNKPYFISGGNLFVIYNKKIEKLDVNFNNDNPQRCLVQDNDVFLGSFSGINQYKIAKNRLLFQQQFPFTGGVSNIIPWLNNTILASSYGRGLIYIHPKNKQLNIYNNLPFNNIENIIPISNNRIAAISFEDGFFTLDSNLKVLQHFTKANGLPTNYITHVYATKNKLLVGTKLGLVFINDNNKIEKVLNSSNGFIGNSISLIFEDNKNQIWVVSNSHIHLLENNYLRAIGSLLPNKLPNKNITNAIFIKATQQLFVCIQNEITNVDMVNFIANTKVSNACILGINIDGTVIGNFNKPFKIPYTHSKLNFLFKPLNNTLVQQQHIYYKLNNQNWQILSNNNILTFQNLRTGKYSLHIKTINEDGYESATTTVAIFYVKSPWWQQWWFFLLIAITIAVFVWKITSFINKKKYYRKLLLEKEIHAERTRISRDLHDNIGVYTTALIANVESLKQKENSLPELANINANAQEIMASLRETIWVLNKPQITSQELCDNFTSYCTKITANFSNLNFSKEEHIENNVIVRPSVAIQALKILQEAFQNSIKHAQATEVQFEVFSSNSQLQLLLTDNGKGFNTKESYKGYGLENMQWRANEANINLTICSNSNGTKISLLI